MRVYVSISPPKKKWALYKAYILFLEQHFNVVKDIYQADVALLLGAWSRRLARVSRKARRIGVPYILIPLGDLSPWERKHPALKRWWQALAYQRGMAENASCLIATTPMEKECLNQLEWNDDVRMVRYPIYTRMATDTSMTEGIDAISQSALSAFEEHRQTQIADMTDNPICRQIMKVYLRMPHHDIPVEDMRDLHTLLMADNYNEDLVVKEMGQLRIKKFAAALFQVMRQVTQLTEGFMPIPYKEGKLAKKISRYIRQ